MSHQDFHQIYDWAGFKSTIILLHTGRGHAEGWTLGTYKLSLSKSGIDTNRTML